MGGHDFKPPHILCQPGAFLAALEQHPDMLPSLALLTPAAVLSSQPLQKGGALPFFRGQVGGGAPARFPPVRPQQHILLLPGGPIQGYLLGQALARQQGAVDHGGDCDADNVVRGALEGGDGDGGGDECGSFTERPGNTLLVRCGARYPCLNSLGGWERESCIVHCQDERVRARARARDRVRARARVTAWTGS